MMFCVLFTWRSWRSEGGWSTKGQRLGLASHLLGFLLIQLIRAQSPGKPLKCRKRGRRAKSDLQFGFRRQDLIWAGGANCFHMKANSEHEHGGSCRRQSFFRVHPLSLFHWLSFSLSASLEAELLWPCCSLTAWFELSLSGWLLFSSPDSSWHWRRNQLWSSSGCMDPGREGHVGHLSPPPRPLFPKPTPDPHMAQGPVGSYTYKHKYLFIYCISVVFKLKLYPLKTWKWIPAPGDSRPPYGSVCFFFLMDVLTLLWFFFFPFLHFLSWSIVHVQYKLQGYNSDSQILKALLHVWWYGSHSVLSDCLWLHGLCPWNSPGKNTGVGCYSLLQVIFPTQGSNLHCRQILYHLNHQGSPYSMYSYYKIPTIFSVLYNTHL